MPQTVREQGAYTAEDWRELPEDARVELVNGELLNLASPNRKHQKIVMKLSAALDVFVGARGGSCEVYPAPFAVNLFGDESTFVEPDVSVVCDHSKLSDRGCEGAPDLIIEVVSPSDPTRDYIAKLGLYQAAGVREYWICDPVREVTYVYCLGDDFSLASYPYANAVPSTVLPGFSANLAEVVAGM